METTLLHISLATYLVTLGIIIAFIFRPSERLNRIGNRSLYISLAVHTFLLAYRSYMSGRVPFTNLYESLLIFSWGITAISTFAIKKQRNSTLLSTAIPISIAALIYASQLDNAIHPLPPVLHSSWLIIHVSLAIISYGAFAVAASMGTIYLWKECIPKSLKLGDIFPDLTELDRAIFTTICWAFSSLLLVIITGSIWAQQAWGSYWSWDPKETWALITSLVYGSHIYLYLEKGWSGRKNAIVAIVGFGVVLFCYLGVNLLMTGLHSYGSTR